MPHLSSGARPNLTQLILVPSIITLAVTLLRLVDGCRWRENRPGVTSRRPPAARKT